MRRIAVFALTALIFSPATLFAGKIELTTYYPAPYGEYKNLTSTQDASFATTSGKVGIGTSAPAATLDVRGQIRSASSTGAVYSTSGATIDWNNGNVIILTGAPGSYTFNNMKEGGAYTLIVQNTTSGQYNFSQTGLTFKFLPANAATTAGKDTVYTFIRAGSTVYVSWILGF